MTVDAEFPAELRAQIDELRDEMARRSLAASVADIAYHVASDIEAGRLVTSVRARFDDEVALAVELGLSEEEARDAVSAGFREVWGEVLT
jgi:hypothetical protein